MTQPLEKFEELGYNAFGPVMLQFQAWLLRESKRQGVDRLFFLAREGYFLQSAYRRAAELGFGGEGPAVPSTYMLASRRCYFGATRKSPKILGEMLDAGPYMGSLHRMLAGRFGFESEDLRALEIGDEDITLPKDANRVLDQLVRKLEWLNARADEERAGLEAYLRQIGATDCERIGLVDLGYSGSMQRYLPTIIDKPVSGFYFASTGRVEEWKYRDNEVLACFGEQCDLGTAPYVYQYSLFLESWLTSPDGQLLYFRNGKAGPEPVMAAPGLMQEHFAVVEAIDRGVARYFGDVAQLCEGRDSGLEGLEWASQEVMVSLLFSKRFEEETRLLSVEDAFTGYGELGVVKWFEEHPT